MCRADAGDIDGAHEDAEKAIGLGRRDFFSCWVRGFIRAERGDRVGAQLDFEQAIELAPTEENADGVRSLAHEYDIPLSRPASPELPCHPRDGRPGLLRDELLLALPRDPLSAGASREACVMAVPDGASRVPDGLTPVPVQSGGPSGWAALGLIALVAIVLVAIVLALATSSPTAPLPPPGTPPPRVAVSLGPVATCPPGSNPDEPGPADQARPPSGLEMSIAFDRTAGRIVLIGQAQTWTFDVCTNTWTRMHPASMPDFDVFSMLVYDAAARQTIYLAADGVWAYDLASDTWTRRGDAPEIDVLQVRLVYDPVGGRVVALALGAPGPTWSGQMWSYDAGPGAWHLIAQHEQLSGETGRQLLLAYDQSVDRLVSYSLDGDVRLFDLRTGTWSAPGAVSPPFSYGTAMMNPFSFGGEIAYDEVAQKTILFSNGVAIAYDAGTDRWETLCGGSIACAIPPECRTSPHLVYDPMNERLVVYGGVFCAGDYWYWVFEGRPPPDEVLAFDPRTREWTVLVERSAARPAPP